MRLHHARVCIWKYVYSIELHRGSDISTFCWKSAAQTPNCMRQKAIKKNSTDITVHVHSNCCVSYFVKYNLHRMFQIRVVDLNEIFCYEQILVSIIHLLDKQS